MAWAERKDRERRRVELEWRARSRRERIRHIGERLVAALGELRAVEARLILAEGSILDELVHLDQFENLGFVRRSDFAREALKLHPRTFRRRIALHRVLESVPALRRPFLEGRVGASQVLVLRDVVTAENVKIWVNVSERLSVRELQSLTRRVKEKRERAAVDGKAAADALDRGEAADALDEADAATENGVRTEGGNAGVGGLEAQSRQCISFLSPQSAAYAIEHGLETARRALGYEAPRDECLEAVLSEAESSLGLPPAPGDSLSGRHDAENGVRRNLDSSNGQNAGGGNATATPYESPIWCHKRELKAARRLLTAVDRRLSRINRLTREPRPDQPISATSASGLVDRYLALQNQKNPIRILIARALHHLSLLGAAGLLGHPNDITLAASLLKITPRSARDLLNAGFAFNYYPPLANAYARGRIGFGQVVALSYEVGPATKPWIHRAREVTARQFRREVRLFQRLQAAAGRGFGWDGDVFPGILLEPKLRKLLFELGWKPEQLDRKLGERRILSPPGASSDPAENPALMARLEILVDMLALERCRQESEVAGRAGLGKLLSVPGRHLRVTVWARDPIAQHWRDAQSRVLARCDHLPDWAVATLLFKAAQDEWDRTDPARVPTEHRILERDGYLCQAPGCSSRKNLEVHHIIFRSNGGTDEDHNLITLCHQHHHHAVHRNTMRVSGEAPYNLTWELGFERTWWNYHVPARWVYRGERLVTDPDTRRPRPNPGVRPVPAPPK